MNPYYELNRDSDRHASAWWSDNDAFPLHFHSSVELMYVVEGELIATQEGEGLALPEGTLFINSSYLLHGYETPTRSRVIVAVVPLTAVPALRARLEGRSFRRSVYRGERSRDLLRLMRMLERAAGDDELRDALATALLLLLIGCVGLTESAVSKQPDLTRSLLQYVQAHLTEELSVPVLARAVGYSVGRVSHVFNERIGCPLGEYVGRLRCRLARSMLEEPNVTVLDAALRAGFGNVRTFYRAYRREFGGTPKAARRAENH